MANATREMESEARRDGAVHCPMCGRKVQRMPRSAKQRRRHKCPHGKWCAQGDPRWGPHSNGNPPPSQRCCRDALVSGEFLGGGR